MVTEDKYTCLCIHDLMMVKVVNCPTTGKGKKVQNISSLSSPSVCDQCKVKNPALKSDI